MNPNFQSACLFTFDFWNSIFLLFLYPVLIWVLWKLPLVHVQWQIKTCAANPNSECHCRLLQTYLMNEYFWIAFPTLLYQSPIAYVILLDLFYIFMSAVTTFPQVFFSARFGCYIECEEIILWYEDQSFKTELVLLTKEIFPVNHASCKKEWHQWCVFMLRGNSSLCLTSPKFTKWTSVLQSKMEVASLTTFYCLTTFKQFSSLQIIAN